MPLPTAPIHTSVARLARRLGTPSPRVWSPPALPELIGRIDAALAERRG